MQVEIQKTATATIVLETEEVSAIYNLFEMAEEQNRLLPTSQINTTQRLLIQEFKVALRSMRGY